MSEGSLEDHLFSQNNATPMPWQLRFKIAAEIATGLHFLHLNKPEPLVHRDLKPDNILLDHSFVCKISDVGLSRLIPLSSVDAISQYRMTAAAGTFCYIDPEYQKTGLLGVKSDIYAFGIILMQLLTAKPPMGLAHSVEMAMESRRFHEILDQSVHDWPVKESIELGKLALRCAELRRKDRPGMETILPELERFQRFADDSLHNVEHFLKANSS